MVSIASGGRADRIAARMLFKVLRAGSGTPARYSSILFGASPAFAADLRVAGLACFMQTMLQALPLQIHRPFVLEITRPCAARYRKIAIERKPMCAERSGLTDKKRGKRRL